MIRVYSCASELRVLQTWLVLSQLELQLRPRTQDTTPGACDVQLCVAIIVYSYATLDERTAPVDGAGDAVIPSIYK